MPAELGPRELRSHALHVLVRNAEFVQRERHRSPQPRVHPDDPAARDVPRELPQRVGALERGAPSGDARELVAGAQ